MKTNWDTLRYSIKREISTELPRFLFCWVFLLSFLTACTTINQLSNTTSSLQVNTGDGNKMRSLPEIVGECS